MRKTKKDDLAKVITGKDKDKVGKVITVNTKVGIVLVEGCNMITKHIRLSTGNPNGDIINQEGSVDIPNVMLVVDGRATKIDFEVRDGKKVRIAKVTGRVID